MLRARLAIGGSIAIFFTNQLGRLLLLAVAEVLKLGQLLLLARGVARWMPTRVLVGVLIGDILSIKFAGIHKKLS